MKKHIIKKKYQNSGIREVDKMTGEQFEYWLKVHFEKEGWRADLTPKSKDFGADLLLRRFDRESIVIQAKRYNSGKVGIKAIQEVLGAKAFHHCDKALVVTSSFFTSSANQLALQSGVELWNRNILIDKLITDQRNGVNI